VDQPLFRPPRASPVTAYNSPGREGLSDPSGATNAIRAADHSPVTPWGQSGLFGLPPSSTPSPPVYMYHRPADDPNVHVDPNTEAPQVDRPLFLHGRTGGIHQNYASDNTVNGGVTGSLLSDGNLESSQDGIKRKEGQSPNAIPDGPDVQRTEEGNSLEQDIQHTHLDRTVSYPHQATPHQPSDTSFIVRPTGSIHR